MRLLFVAKDAKPRRMLSAYLHRERYVIDCLDETETAWEAALVNSYDVIVVDSQSLPIDTCFWCRDLRARGGETPVLILTPGTTPEARIQNLDCGADDCLDHPFANEELLARLRALSRRKHHRTENRLHVGDLVLNPTSYEASRAGCPIRLSALEFRLLECLMAAQGRVVSRATIMERVWDMNFASDTNVIEVYISYLRSKIDRNFAPPLIHTVRGVGYMIKESAEEPGSSLAAFALTRHREKNNAKSS